MVTNVRILSVVAIAVVIYAAAVDEPTARANSDKLIDRKNTLAFGGDPNEPRRHFHVRDVAELKAIERAGLYRKIRDRLKAGYAVSGDPTAKAYQSWSRVNTAPYLSATHGRRFINNFTNSKAAAYATYEMAGTLPVGSIVAKDSFVVGKDGSLTPGPLFIMEKMAKGFSYVSGDWRYSMIMPDGSLFGTTKGENAKRVEFCIGCHLAREKYDHLYFVPKSPSGDFM